MSTLSSNVRDAQSRVSGQALELAVEPTNNRAERILRLAVIARKVSHCSKTQEGADAFAAFASIAQTAIKNGETSVASAFCALFTAPHARPNEHSPP